MTLIDVLFKAALARQASWDARAELETALGFPDGHVPDAVDTYLYDTVGDLATGTYRGRVSVHTADAERIARRVKELTPEDWPK